MAEMESNEHAVTEVITRSVEETVALGERWGRELGTGWVVALDGDLGAGKTQLARGIARGLGFSGRVQSPTFALINIYEGGRVPMFHLDLYRLDDVSAVYDAGLSEYLDEPEGLAVVEWAARWLPEAGPVKRLRRVLIESPTETERRICYEDLGV
jgi:tRNA threonylcarbamoyladenosine biosynthesis protein TsaE